MTKMIGEPDNPEYGDTFTSLSGYEYYWNGQRWEVTFVPPRRDKFYIKKI